MRQAAAGQRADIPPGAVLAGRSVAEEQSPVAGTPAEGSQRHLVPLPGMCQAEADSLGTLASCAPTPVLKTDRARGTGQMDTRAHGLALEASPQSQIGWVAGCQAGTPALVGRHPRPELACWMWGAETLFCSEPGPNPARHCIWGPC